MFNKLFLAIIFQLFILNNIPTFSSEFHLYIHDHLGNTRVVLNEAGDVVESYDYYPFGMVLRRTLSQPIGTIDTFTGKELDEDGNLDWYYFGARYYDPRIGRWMVVDPMADKTLSFTPYHYCSNNPVNRFDSDGLKDTWAAVKAMSRIAGGVGAWGTGFSVGVFAAKIGFDSAGSLYPLALPAAGAAFGAMVWGSTEIAYGIVDFQLALSTPDGMKAEAWGTIVNTLGSQFGMNSSVQSFGNLACEILIVGTQIPKNMYTADVARIIEAVRESGEISEDFIQLVEDVDVYLKNKKNENTRDRGKNSSRRK